VARRELVDHLLSIPPAERLWAQGMRGRRWQRFLTVAGMVGVVTAMLAGSAAGLLAAIAADHSLVAALVAGTVVAVAALAWLMHHQRSAWKQARAAPMFPDDEIGSR
jgi:NhaP-type Na+/H+ or K+/H+ antiporter